MKDSIDLLKAEIAKEEALLADEKKSLQEMDKNAKRAEAERKRQAKNVRTCPTSPCTHLLTLPSRNTLCSGN
jgi:phage terminase Nu1 subunit (DNA packaging protein)